MKRIKHILCFIFLLLGVCAMPTAVVQAGSLFDSDYVKKSPDGKAWTISPPAGVAYDYTEQYEEGTTVTTGISSQLRTLRVGEHYYAYTRSGDIPIGKWIVEHQYAQCIHHDYPGGNAIYGVVFNKSNCMKYYNSGWIAYCADCQQEVRHMYVYMTKDAAESIDYMSCDQGYDHYFLCPHCNNLEQGATVKGHTCKAISWNQYAVRYNANADSLPWAPSGYMSNSYHMYNNATVYEGQPVTPVTHLTKNGFTCSGYTFVGWNTKPDGSGKQYSDGAKILNLNVNDYWSAEDSETAVVDLYAQWKPTTSVLKIIPGTAEEIKNKAAYDGKSGETVITQGYGTSYYLDPNKVTPPSGYTVSFDACGGNAVASKVAVKKFKDWIKGEPFLGVLLNNTYFFSAPDGNVDVVTAVYDNGSVTLPNATWKGRSFGGWYYDKGYTKYAGCEGTEITPQSNMTLYAQWVDLTLYSKDDYVSNNKKGAVDLWWAQPDITAKTYKLYQSMDKNTWKEIHAADDIGSTKSVNETLAYTDGLAKAFTIEYSGIYMLTASGGQGGSFGSGTSKKTGGKGGSVSGNFYLKKGDIITYTVGGKGANGADGVGGTGGYSGGDGGTYGAGGGAATTVSVTRNGIQTTLLIAAGGGGATSLGNGGDGGETDTSNLRASKSAGETSSKGGSGGGGGYRGGKAGAVVPHVCSDAKGCYINHAVNLAVTNAEYKNKKYGAITTVLDPVLVPDETDEGEMDSHGHKKITIGSASKLIPVQKGYTLNLTASIKAFKDNRSSIKNSLKVYNQKGNIIYQETEDTVKKWIKNQSNKIEHSATNKGDTGYANEQSGKYTAAFLKKRDASGSLLGVSTFWLSWDGDGVAWKNSKYFDDDDDRDALVFFNNTIRAVTRNKGYDEYFKEDDNAAYGSWTLVFREEITIPAGTTGIYIVAEGIAETNWPTDPTMSFPTATLKGSEKICNKEYDNVYPAYGGSSYINTDASICSSSSSTKGAQAGNGSFSIKSVSIGFLDEMKLDDVVAPDLAAPEKIATTGVGVDGKDVISYEAVAGSNGTKINVMWVEPLDKGTTYYHMAESYQIPSGTKLCTSNLVENTLTTGVYGYYYKIDTVASTVVTKADSFTLKNTPSAVVSFAEYSQYLHIAAVDVAGNIGETAHILIKPDVKWPIRTEPISISNGSNVYPAAAANTWYVRADGITPFTLSFGAYMEGSATDNYQINQTIFESQLQGKQTAWNLIETPIHALQNGAVETPASELAFAVSGSPVLRNYSYTKTVRSNRNVDLDTEHQLLIGSETHGKLTRITPRAGVVTDDYNEYSDLNLDISNSIYIIGDSVAPVIGGLDELRALDLVDKKDMALEITLTATDTESGVKEFYAVLTNNDNHTTKTITSLDNSTLTFDVIVDEAVFNGDVVVEVYSVDNVGNERVETHDFTEFELIVSVKRILAPHDPLFKGGESGILTVTTKGYVDSVTIDFPTILDGYDCVVDYPIPNYIQEENIEFVLPLKVVTDIHEIKVTAQKNGRQLTAVPEIGTLESEGTILDEFKVRIR